MKKYHSLLELLTIHIHSEFIICGEGTHYFILRGWKLNAALWDPLAQETMITLIIHWSWIEGKRE